MPRRAWRANVTPGPLTPRRLPRVRDWFVANDYLVPLDRDNDGVPEDYYFNFVYHPLTEPDGSVSGIVVVGTDVTESMRARRDAERLRAPRRVRGSVSRSAAISRVAWVAI